VGQLYDTIGKTYADYRRPDPRIATAIKNALGDAQSIVNVGAGAGSYEPMDRQVVAVEPSAVMIAQRPSGAAPVVRVSAMNLPFCDDAFDAALAIFTVHHWPNQPQGLREMSRVARRCVVFTWDNQYPRMWLTRDYFPEIVEHGRTICAPIERYGQAFQQVQIISVPIPHDCADGFLHAYWRRPEAYFDSGLRSAISAFANIRAETGLAALRRDLDDGTWLRRNAHLLELNELDLGYRLVIGTR
jgi:SAM-dependent methyltransferase